MILTYQANGKVFSSASPMDVFVGDHQIGRVTQTSGFLIKGPTWTWHNQHGPEWTMTSSMGTYTLTTTAGHQVASLKKQRLRRDVNLATADGWHGVADHVGWGSGQTRILGPAGEHVASVSRRTSFGSRMLSQRETWDLTIHAELATHAQYAVSAMPLVVDHLQRKAESSG